MNFQDWNFLECIGAITVVSIVLFVGYVLVCLYSFGKQDEHLEGDEHEHF